MLDHLKLLVADMKNLGWIIDGFLFSFHHYRYYVLVILYQEGEYKPAYALAKLQFVDSQDTNRTYIIHANSRDFIDLDIKSFRDFFHIPFGNSLGDVISDFKQSLNIDIPIKVYQDKDKFLQKSIIDYMVGSDSKDPNKKYCIGVKRNKVGEFRTDFNDNKARLLAPEVYHYFSHDKTLSFCFSENPEDKKDDAEIIRKFLER